MTTLTSTSTLTPEGWCVALAGQADITNFDVLREALFAHLPPGATALIIDASALEYLDSMALRSVAMAARVLKKHQGVLTVLNPQDAVLKLLKLTGADTYMNILHTTQAETGRGPRLRRSRGPRGSGWLSRPARCRTGPATGGR